MTDLSILKIHPLFLHYIVDKMAIDITGECSPKEEISMKCQAVFPGKNKKKSIIKLLSADFPQGALIVKELQQDLTRNRFCPEVWAMCTMV